MHMKLYPRMNMRDMTTVYYLGYLTWEVLSLLASNFIETGRWVCLFVTEISRDEIRIFLVSNILRRDRLFFVWNILQTRRDRLSFVSNILQMRRDRLFFDWNILDTRRDRLFFVSSRALLTHIKWSTAYLYNYSLFM